ncbi:hypothetical protein EUTSA_v10011090mg [Eutrema salsugineum]|uniref:F-box domain-containing protein n=1 Tax=Eutrema salsugineum TaxID=72664 RepID=V4M012_EUTSA|nr:putative F-box protein At1g57580 [Eutrema salsugineum]ESQ45488.1 hypothetical protein EUTSA_v10011090mg [Eutrema salsugineum]
MDGLPGHLLDIILFRIDPRSLAILRCTNRSLKSHIYDPVFESEFFSLIRSGVLHISTFGSTKLCYHPHGDSRSLRIKDTAMMCHILGSCSGLLLLCIKEDLCVANPLTKKFQFLKPSLFMKSRGLFRGVNTEHIMLWPRLVRHIGFAVHQIDRTTWSFKIVHMIQEDEKPDKRRYSFEINAGDSWRRSKTTITCDSSNLDERIRNPVFFDRSLHWLRNDGSIVAFNPETEQARLVPIKFPEGMSLKTLFAAGDISLSLISATKEAIYVYALENILSDDPKWVVVTQIRNVLLNANMLGYWNLEAYDGKRLVLREDRRVNEDRVYYRVVHVYDLSANKWVVLGSVPTWADAHRNIFQFTPSFSSVVGLDQKLACDDKRISSLSTIMALIDDGTSSEEVEKQLRKRSVEAEEKRVVRKKRESNLEKVRLWTNSYDVSLVYEPCV